MDCVPKCGLLDTLPSVDRCLLSFLINLALIFTQLPENNPRPLNSKNNPRSQVHNSFLTAQQLFVPYNVREEFHRGVRDLLGVLSLAVLSDILTDRNRHNCFSLPNSSIRSFRFCKALGLIHDVDSLHSSSW